MKDPFLLSSYRYELPTELIAQYPCEPKDNSRLMIVDRQTGNFSEIVFRELVHFLKPSDSLVFNDTKVIPARFFGKKESGAQIELLLIRKLTSSKWIAMAKPSRKLPVGSTIFFNDSLYCNVLESLDDGQKLIQFFPEEGIEEALQEFGHIPLPRYIRKGIDEVDDHKNYQTVYAQSAGAFAAPTAGLHFTNEMLQDLEEKKIGMTKLTLHVGLGTFQPVSSSDIREHRMHSEYVSISQDAADALNKRSLESTQVIVGTTTCRSLESSARNDGVIKAGDFWTDIFIYPGYHFNYVRTMLTNFHQPESSLLMLVSAFAGYELMMEAYKKAVKEKYRFFSYGDAMLIL